MWYMLKEVQSLAHRMKRGDADDCRNRKNRKCGNTSSWRLLRWENQWGDTKNNQITIQTVKPDGTITSKDYPVGSIPYKIVTVNSANKTSRDDLAVSGTH